MIPEPRMKTLEAGQTFADKYRVVRCIAAGGMGAVYEVVHEETQRTLALKVLLPTFIDRVELRDRFRTEARITAPIQSDAIVQVYDAGVDQESGMPYLAMELLQGEPLDQRIAREKQLSPGKVCGCLMHLARALDKTHAAQIVHRDLKPENLFIARKDDGTEQLKILDFGLAKIVEEKGAMSSHTSSVGTPLYMAPEQFRSGVVTPATDLYALAMLAYTMLVGAPYWNDEACKHRTLVAFAMIAADGPSEAASVRAARSGVALPRAFDAWFARMTRVDPRQRPAKASDAARELAEIFDVLLPAGMSSPDWPVLSRSEAGASHSVSGHPISAMSATLAGNAITQRRFVTPVRVAVVVVALTALLGGAWMWNRRAPALGAAVPSSFASAEPPAGQPTLSAVPPSVIHPDASASEPPVAVPPPDASPPKAATPPAPTQPARTPPAPSAAPPPSGRNPLYFRE